MESRYNDIIKDVIENFSKITKVELNKVFNSEVSENTPIFNQEVVDKTTPMIKDYLIEKYKFDPDKSDKFWYDLDEMLEPLNPYNQRKDNARDLLRYLIYQVCNGGAIQYCWNGYADELLEYKKDHDIVDELINMECPLLGIRFMKKMLENLNNNNPTRICPECDGEGDHEDWDGEYIKCSYCEGEGDVEAENWETADEQPWMEEYDKWMYSFDLKELDDWTGQSHNHSVMLDIIEQNKKENEEK